MTIPFDKNNVAHWEMRCHALAAKLERAEGLLRVAHPHVDDKALWEAIRALIEKEGM